MSRPPLLPPWIASFSGRVYFCLIRYCGCGREIIENVLFVRQIAGLVPFLAKFASTPNIGDDIDSSRSNHSRAKNQRRRHANAIAAIASRAASDFTRRASFLCGEDIKRDPGPILRRSRIPASLRCRRTRPASCRQARSSPARIVRLQRMKPGRRSVKLVRGKAANHLPAQAIPEHWRLAQWGSIVAFSRQERTGEPGRAA